MKDRGGAEGIMLLGGGGGGSESPIITTRQTQVATLSIENSRRSLALLHQVCASLHRAPYHSMWKGGHPPFPPKKIKKRGKEEKYTEEM